MIDLNYIFDQIVLSVFVLFVSVIYLWCLKIFHKLSPGKGKEEALDTMSSLVKTLADVPEGSFSVFLYHYPKGVIAASKHKIDLFCTGHTHGGQVRLPFYGALITASGLSRNYDRGLFDFKGTKMHISQGTGMTGVPIRFLAPPQITLIEIEPAELTAD